MNEQHLRCIANILQAIFIFKREDIFEHCKLCPYNLECFDFDNGKTIVYAGFYDMLRYLEKETGVFLGYDTGL